MQKVPQEIIVVEGRDDTKRLIETFGPTIKTIETNGSAVSRTVLQQIQRAAATHGIIILTDPDYQGDRIRRIVTEAVPQAKQAYLTVEQAYGGAQCSLGVEHATPEVLRQALANVVELRPEADLVELISLDVLYDYGLIGGAGATQKRAAVSRYFNLGHLNGKQLQKQLQRYGIAQAKLVAFLEQELAE